MTFTHHLAFRAVIARWESAGKIHVISTLETSPPPSSRQPSARGSLPADSLPPSRANSAKPEQGEAVNTPLKDNPVSQKAIRPPPAESERISRLAINQFTGDKDVLLIVGAHDAKDEALTSALLDSLRHLNIKPMVLLLMSAYDPVKRAKALIQGADWVFELDSTDAVLDARFDALRRRCRHLDSVQIRDFPPYVLYRRLLEVRYRGQSIRLSDLDFRLIEYLFLHHDKPLSRHDLLTDVWKVNLIDSRRRVDTKISHLRTRLQLDGRNGWVLRSNRKADGYLFCKESRLELS